MTRVRLAVVSVLLSLSLLAAACDAIKVPTTLPSPAKTTNVTPNATTESSLLPVSFSGFTTKDSMGEGQVADAKRLSNAEITNILDAKLSSSLLIAFKVQVSPTNLKTNTGYYVILQSVKGYVYEAAYISFKDRELVKIDPNERNQIIIDQAMANNALEKISVILYAPTTDKDIYLLAQHYLDGATEEFRLPAGMPRRWEAEPNLWNPKYVNAIIIEENQLANYKGIKIRPQ